MSRIVAIIILAFIGILSVDAQSDHKNYIQMRDEGTNFFRNNKYSDALRLYEGAKGFASDLNDRSEINVLERTVRDTVNKRYNDVIKSFEVAKNKLDFSIVKNKFNSFFPIDNLYVPNIYSWIGCCFERMGEPSAAIEQYNKGLEHQESYSAYRLASLLKGYSKVSSDSIVNLLLYASRDYKDAYNQLGDMYYQASPQKAYDYYKKSNTQYGRYQMASLRLDENKNVHGGNPIEILQALSDENYPAAQYYLGLLYFHGAYYITQNEEKGLTLIKRASNNGDVDAKKWIENRNEELRKLQYLY